MAYLTTGKIIDADPHALGLSNGASVTELSNQVAAQNEGVQASSGNRATILTGETGASKAAAVFDGNDYYSFGNILSGLSEGTIYALVKMDSDPSVAPYNGGLWTTNVTGSASHVPFSDGNVYEGWGSSTRRSTGNPTPDFSTAYRLYTVVSKTNDFRIYIDGTLYYSDTSNTVSFPSDFKFGTSSVADSFYFKGKLLRLLAYSVGHTGAEVTSNKTEFGTEYQLTNLGYGGSVPADVTGLTKTAEASGSVSIDWDDVSGATDYKLKVVRVSDSVVISEADLGSTTSSKTVTGLTNGVQYSFTVKAKNGAGYSVNYPTAVTGTPTSGSDTTRPSDVPGAVATYNSGTGKIDLASSPATDNVAVTGYIWRRATNVGMTAGLVDPLHDTGSPSSAYSDAAVSPGQTYFYQSKAYDGNSNLSLNWSDPVSATVWNAAPTFTTAASLGNVNINTPTDFTIETTGGDGTRTISAPSGLPSGVTRVGNVLTVDKSTAGLVSIPLRVTDANDQYSNRTFTVTLIDPADVPPGTFIFDAVRLPYFHGDWVKDWDAVTRSHSYEDGSISFNELNDNAPQTCKLIYQPKNGEWDIFDAHEDAFRRSRSFVFVDKWGNFNTVFYKSYDKDHDGNKSMVKSRTIVFIKYP